VDDGKELADVVGAVNGTIVENLLTSLEINATRYRFSMKEDLRASYSFFLFFYFLLIIVLESYPL